MPNDELPTRTNSSTAGWSAIIVALPVFYVLSIGPVAYLIRLFHLHLSASSWIVKFYEPVLWLHDHTWLKPLLNDYLDWWMDLGSRP